MKNLDLNKFSVLPKLKLAVIGHVEWVTFLKVDNLPKEGRISHSKKSVEEPAGGGAVAAVQMRNLTNRNVHFFTALGRDEIGQRSKHRLENLGLTLHIAWKDKPTRKGISFVDPNGERAITVIGQRLQPIYKDDLPWDELSTFDGVFLTATDTKCIQACRAAKVLTATPRLGIESLKGSKVKLDALIGSGLDPDEQINHNELQNSPKVIIETQGESGGIAYPGGRYEAQKLVSPLIDAYGCGDSFAAGVTVGLAAKMELRKAISIGAHCGSRCASYFGPYPFIN